MEGFNSNRTTSSKYCHDCFRGLDPGELAGVGKRTLVEVDDTVEVDTVL